MKRKILCALTMSVLLLSIVVASSGNYLYLQNTAGENESANTLAPFTSGGVPLRLAVFTVPKLLAINTYYYYVITVQLQDLYGNPTPAPENIYVSLSSSNASVGYPDAGYILIYGGDTEGHGHFRTTYTPGVTTISATSPGLIPGYATMTTQSDSGSNNPPVKLAVIFAPDKIPATGQYYYCLRVQLQDALGNPIRAPDSVGISLRSSNPGVAGVPTTIEISEGYTGEVTYVSTTMGNGGSVTINASASGYASASGTVNVVGLGGTATKLVVYAVPKIIAWGGSHNDIIAVQLRDASDLPSNAPTNIGVSLRSSDTRVGTIGSYTTIYSGYNFVSPNFLDGWASGSTTINASSAGLTSDSAIITSGQWFPKKLLTLAEFPSMFFEGPPYKLSGKIVVGETGSHGPFGIGAATLDVYSGLFLAQAIGYTVPNEPASETMSVAIDTWIASYDYGTGIVTVTDTTSDLIGIAGYGVNLITYQYATDFAGAFSGVRTPVAPVYFHREWDPNPANVRTWIVFPGRPLTYSDWDIVAGSKDYALIELAYDTTNDRYILVVTGFTAQGVEAACKILAARLTGTTDFVLRGKAMLFMWTDMNADSRAQLNEVSEVTTYP